METAMFHRKSLLKALAVLPCICALLIGASDGQAGSDETEAICAEAEERYQELYSDLPIDEGTVVIKMFKYTFCPIELEVPVGTKIRWINVDKRTSHSVWFKEAGQEESERFFPDEFFEMTMSEPGHFNYICGPHGEQQEMRATVTVTP